jgi:membrane fusion protein, multidrug efflux system
MGANRATRRSLITAAIAAELVACAVYLFPGGGKGQGAAPAADAGPVPVTVRTLAEQKVHIWSEFSGRLQPVDAAEIRPEVSGRITEVRFEDGQSVKAGDVLFVIDPRPYEAAVAHAEAALASARTNAAYAKLDSDRAAALVGLHTITQREFDQRANAGRVADAAVMTAKADLKRALLDLEHAHVLAPISGRASRPEITVGNLVMAGPGAPLMTTIVANDTVYASFEVDEQTYVESIRNTANGRDQERRIAVKLSLPGDKSQVYRGTVYSFDNRIDAGTGTIRVRAKFANADGALLPGMFVSVQLAQGAERNELLISERAIGFDQNKKFVYVVGADDRIAYREVLLGKEVQSQRIVLNGLRPGDRVVVDGVQRIQPNALVLAREAAPDLVAANDEAPGPRSEIARP